MPQAIMDPGEVRRFAEELKRFNIEVQNRMALLQARFAALGDTWQDQEHTKFSEEFRDTMKVLKKFIETSNQHTPFLLRKAQRIESIWTNIEPVTFFNEPLHSLIQHQHRTTNVGPGHIIASIEVGCWMLDVRCFPFPRHA
jgi:uncharacterized protein YukE